MLSNPIYDPFQILTKIYQNGTHVKQAIADTYIEEQYRSRTVKIVYGVLENDGYFDFCIKYYAPKAPKPVVRLLLKISLYACEKKYTPTFKPAEEAPFILALNFGSSINAPVLEPRYPQRIIT